ncbi:MAG: acyltransferase [Acidobacteriota bacterium]|nr:acyltransferase [Acidobacteriota bacterium]
MNASLLDTALDSGTKSAVVPLPVPDPKPRTVGTRKPALPALTGIRTLLAFSIVLFHFTPPHLGLLYPIIDNGYIFVGVFFLISGYILTYNYADRARTLVKREFWLARFSRLYPVYLLVLILSLHMLGEEWHARSHFEFWQGLILTPLVLQGWSPSVATFWNTVAWTLSSEVVLYAAFPWLIRLRWPTRPSTLVGLFLALWAIGLIPHSLYLLLNPDHLTGPIDRYSSTQWLRFLKFTPLPYVCTFLAGVTLGKIQLALTFRPRQRLALAALSLAVSGIFFYTLVLHTPYLLMHGGLMTPVFAALVLGLSGPHLISSAFSWRPLLLVGESSYCLYLLHFNVFQLLHMYHVPERLHLAEFEPWLSYVILVLLSLAVFHLVEVPARKALLRRFSNKPRSLPATG